MIIRLTVNRSYRLLRAAPRLDEPVSPLAVITAVCGRLRKFVRKESFAYLCTVSGRV